MTKSSHFRTTLVATAALLAAGGALAASVPPTVLYTFPGGSVGDGPTGLTQAGGLLYGTLVFGGAGNSGSVYSLNPATNAVTVLYGFGAAGSGDGANPDFPPVVLNGVLYGTTQSGGSAGMGSVFAIDLSTNTETFLTSFLGGTDGKAPGNLVALNGTLYGTTRVGGTPGGGTLFSINPTTGAKTILYNFLGGADGSNPGNLAVLNGTLYGTTGNASSVFQFNTATNTKTIIYSFPQAGAGPSGPPLIVGTMLYGVTSNDGPAGLGSVYAINLSTGAGSTLYAFKGGTKDGNLPGGNLVASKGVLYGATLYGGSTGCFQKFGCGTLFAVKASTGAEKVLYKYPKKDSADSPFLYSEGGIIYGTQNDGLFTWAP